ncbi:unnamed protein product [Cylicocyclus nassatus]|uniref:Uncharacterized protein n=1 Tax=Cylicocyclus nassatus TaxID=53992 RepID=A0AA36GXH9_CYLNA|nr:unnamed protein product [Cylicocyclus nassatus]
MVANDQCGAIVVAIQDFHLFVLFMAWYLPNSQCISPRIPLSYAYSNPALPNNGAHEMEFLQAIKCGRILQRASIELESTC